MKYCIVGPMWCADLARKVNQFIAEGWIPQGGLTADHSERSHYLQAMIKLDDI